MAGEGSEGATCKVVSLSESRDVTVRARATSRDQVEYIADLLDELRTMAERARASDLADLLASARREAGRLATARSRGA